MLFLSNVLFSCKCKCLFLDNFLKTHAKYVYFRKKNTICRMMNASHARFFEIIVNGYFLQHKLKTNTVPIQPILLTFWKIVQHK